MSLAQTLLILLSLLVLNCDTKSASHGKNHPTRRGYIMGLKLTFNQTLEKIHEKRLQLTNGKTSPRLRTSTLTLPPFSPAHSPPHPPPQPPHPSPNPAHRSPSPPPPPSSPSPQCPSYSPRSLVPCVSVAARANQGVRGEWLPRQQSSDGQNPRKEWKRADLPPAHKPAPPPPKKKTCDMKGHLTSEDIQVVHLDKDEEMQKLPLQPPYYDMAPSESTPFTDKMNCGRRPEDVLNPAPYVTYQPICSMETFSQPAPPPAAHPQPPTSFLPQHPYAHPHRPLHQQPPGQEISYPPNMGHPVPGPRAPFTYSREQSV